MKVHNAHNSNDIAYLLNSLTYLYKVGFVQLGLDVEAIGGSAYPSIYSGLTNIAKHWL